MESKRTVQMNLFIRQRVTDVKASLRLPGHKAGGEINWNRHKHTNLYIYIYIYIYKRPTVAKSRTRLK